MTHVLKAKDPATNVGETERWISIIGGSSLLAYGLTRGDKAGFGLAALAGGMLWRGATGHCGMYQALGINNSDHRGHGKGTGVRAGVPYELGIRVDHEIHINKPVDEIYRFWRHLENLPRFMNHLESVKEVNERISHWCAKGPAGYNVEWDAEIVNDVPNRVIGWRSLDGSQVSSGGSVRFQSTEDGGTDLKISLQYNPPGGTLGKWAAKLFGEDPQQTVYQDLTRFKELMETGNIKQTEAKPRAVNAKPNKMDKWDRDAVTSSSEESFPASDPPSWTPEAL